MKHCLYKLNRQPLFISNIDTSFNAKKEGQALYLFTTTHLNGFLNNVVQDEEKEDALTSHHEIVSQRHIADQLNGTESERWDGTTSGRELYNQSEKIKQTIQNLFLSTTFCKIN